MSKRRYSQTANTAHRESKAPDAITQYRQATGEESGARNDCDQLADGAMVYVGESVL